MPIESVFIKAVEPTRGKGFKIKTGSETLFVFDAQASEACKLAVGTAVNCDVTRKENKDGNVFPTIQSVHGPADGSVAAPAPTPAAAPPPASAAASRGGGAGGQFKKDPLGIVLGSRQTALNAAVAYHASDSNAEVAEVIATAKAFNVYLLGGLGKRITDDGMTQDEVFPRG